MIQPQAPRGWMQIQMSPSSSPGRTVVALDPGEERDAGGDLRRLLQGEQPRQNAAVAAAVEHEAASQLEPASGLEVEDAHRDLVVGHLDRFHLVVEAHLHPLPSRCGGQGLVEIVPRHLEGLGSLSGEDVGEAEARPSFTIEKQGRVLGLVATGGHCLEQARLGEDVVASRKEGLTDLETRKGSSLEADDPVALPREQRARDAAGRTSSNDEDVGVHGSGRARGRRSRSTADLGEVSRCPTSSGSCGQDVR